MEFKDEFVNGLIRSTIVYTARHLLINRARSLRDEIITEDFRNSVDAAPIIQMIPTC